MAVGRTPWVWMPLVIIALVPLCCTQRGMSASELSGSWVVTRPTRARLPPDVRGAAATVRFEATGEFSARELPGGLLGEQPANPAATALRVITGSGTWKLILRRGGPDVQLTFDSIEGSPSMRTPYATRLHVWDHRPAILLFYFEGDPGEGKRIEFERHR